jgi:hypothetical protein
MAQGMLPFHYDEEKTGSGMTALGGLPLYLELMHVAGVLESLRREVQVAGEQGWDDVQVVQALVLLQLAGGEAVDDLRLLEADAGFCTVLRQVETSGLPRRLRRALLARWRKERTRAVPSPSAAFRYLERFQPAAEELAQQGQATIPAPTPGLRGLYRVNRDFLAWVQQCRPQTEATLDMDATLIESFKRDALFCYQHYQAYQPLTVRWAEQGVIAHSEFRDGNVPAGYQQLRVLQEALAMLPPGVQQVRLRSDTAGYEQELLRSCAEGKHPRFGVIEFAVGVDVTAAFKTAVAQLAPEDWQPLERVDQAGQRHRTGQEWAEVCFVPNWVGQSLKGPTYRFLATREPLAQRALPGLEVAADQLSFPSITLGEQRYKLHGVVTNRLTLAGDAVIRWYRERCGKGEEVHKVLKEDLAGGVLPSGQFGANAAWWAITVLAHNLHVAAQLLALTVAWLGKRLKAVRFALIGAPGRVVRHARGLAIRLSHGHPALPVLLAARQRLLVLARGSPG